MLDNEIRKQLDTIIKANEKLAKKIDELEGKVEAKPSITTTTINTTVGAGVTAVAKTSNFFRGLGKAISNTVNELATVGAEAREMAKEKKEYEKQAKEQIKQHMHERHPAHS
jgi:cell division septum initiation protein DivIVA